MCVRERSHVKVVLGKREVRMNVEFGGNEEVLIIDECNCISLRKKRKGQETFGAGCLDIMRDGWWESGFSVGGAQRFFL